MIVNVQNEIELNEVLVKKKVKKADFETAIAATGFGKFNIIILLATIPTCWASIFQLTTISYVFPAAQCDLDLSLEDKGLLSGITFAGMTFSAFLWGFLYDTYGRSKLLRINFFLDALSVILSGLSQNITQLMIAKFLGGFIMSGPFAALTTYFSEIQEFKNRPRIPLVMGISYALGGIYLPFLASFVLPLKTTWHLDENFVIHSWGIFLLINSIPSLVSGLIFCFLPESPKFLMAMGRNDEALNVFRNIYSMNTGNERKSFPIQELEIENPNGAANKSEKKFFSKTFAQTQSLFNAKLLKNFVLVCFLQMFMTASFYTLRLWMPQLFQAVNDYKFLNNGTSSNLCEMLTALRHEKEEKKCFVNSDNFEVYTNSMTVCVVTMVGYILASSLVNWLGQNKLLAIISFISGCSALGIYFSANGVAATVFIAACSSSASIGVNACIVVIVNLFPTTLRTITLSLAMVFGRIAMMIGNMVFPLLLEMGCSPPFLALAFLGFACTATCIFLPKKNTNFT